MAELKTRPHDGDVAAFLDSVESARRRRDAREVLALMTRVTGEEPKMWGPSIVGFGDDHYRYESGREGDGFVAVLSPRKQALTLYIMSGFKRHDELMSRLGKYKTGKAFLYIETLEDVDLEVLEDLVAGSVEYVREHSA